MLLSLRQKSFIIISLSILFFVGMAFVNVYEYKKQNAEATHEPPVNEKSKVCIDCHTEKGISMGAIREWKLSKHAENSVGCTNCHGEDEDYVHEIKGAVPASKCASCHRDQYLQYKDSKHSQAWIKMQKSAMYKATPDTMKETMCASCHNVGWVRLIPKPAKVASATAVEEEKKCHGVPRVDKTAMSQIKSGVMEKVGAASGKSEGKDKAESKDTKAPEEEAGDDDFFGDSEEAEVDKFAILDPNSKDVSVGKCDLCHTRHRFNLQEARSPQACMNCHLGHNSLMGTSGNYSNSKHGIINQIEVGGSRMEPSCLNCHPGHKNYYVLDDGKKGRAPTCATCHMSKGHDVSKGISVGGIGTGGTVEGQKKLSFKTYTLSKMEFEKARVSMTILCQNCHTSQFGNRMLKQADNVKKECDRVLSEAVAIVRKLNKDKLIKASEAGEYTQPWEFNTNSSRKDMSTAETLLIDLYSYYVSIWKSAYHMNDQNNQMQGWAMLNTKLSQIKAEDRRLRTGKSAPAPKPANFPELK